MSQMNNPSAVCRTERVIPAAPRSVYAAFERPDQLARWWGPNGFTNTFEQFEFEPGGRWAFVMAMARRDQLPQRECLPELQPDAKVVIEHVSPPRFSSP
ncbi:MAG: SRPBCC domain-containing protein [Gemmataceae bacterium]